MSKKKLQDNSPSTDNVNTAPSRRSSKVVTEASDRSPATQTASTTSEEVLASARESDLAQRVNPSHADIAAAAYQRYLQRGGTDGDDLADWIEAERELSKRRSG